MTEYLAWALDRARAQTLALVADIPSGQMSQQSRPGDRHPGWLLGHLLLADTYLLSLLEVQPLTDEFQTLLDRYGPTSAPSGQTPADSKASLVERLARANTLRIARVGGMTASDLASPLLDPNLAPTQPTIGHHLQSLVFHEGYHGGQLSAWRRTHGFAAVGWAFAGAARRL